MVKGREFCHCTVLFAVELLRSIFFHTDKVEIVFVSHSGGDDIDVVRQQGDRSVHRHLFVQRTVIVGMEEVEGVIGRETAAAAGDVTPHGAETDVRCAEHRKAAVGPEQIDLVILGGAQPLAPGAPEQNLFADKGGGAHGESVQRDLCLRSGREIPEHHPRLLVVQTLKPVAPADAARPGFVHGHSGHVKQRIRQQFLRVIPGIAQKQAGPYLVDHTLSVEPEGEFIKDTVILFLFQFL